MMLETEFEISIQSLPEMSAQGNSVAIRKSTKIKGNDCISIEIYNFKSEDYTGGFDRIKILL